MGSIMMKTFNDLIIWQKVMKLVDMIYLLTRSFPKQEMYGLTTQMRWAASSLLVNIAEDNGRKRSRKDYQRFLSEANGSIMDLKTHILVAGLLNFLTKEKMEQLLTQLQSVGKLLSDMKNSPDSKDSNFLFPVSKSPSSRHI